MSTDISISTKPQTNVQADALSRVLFDSPFEWVIVGGVAVVGLCVMVALLLAPHFILPEEDAVILFQYSRNLAHSGAITYILHGPHVEGATDFLWMLLIAGGIRLHIEPFHFVALANTVSLVALPWVLLRIAGRRLTPIAALFIVGAFGLMPQASAATLGFSVLPFACLMAAAALFFLEQNDVALGIGALVLCLFRPDGLVFALPLLSFALLLRPGRRRRAAIYGMTFALPGILYFLWRWRYFQEWLPLPFLVKADTLRVAHVFVPASIQHGLLLGVFAFALATLALYKQRVRVETLAIAFSLLVLPNLFYFAMRLDQNAGHRFFIYLPLGAAIVIAMQWETLGHRRAMLHCGVALWLLLVCRISYNAAYAGWEAQFDNRVAIAHDLSLLPHGTLLVTEAGFLPYGSGWTTYDAWGLNTPRFAHRLLQPSEVSEICPDAILVYTGSGVGCKTANATTAPYTTRTWPHMTSNLLDGAVNDYALWYAPYGNLRHRAARGIAPWQGDQECWLIRNDSPLRAGVETTLSHHGGESAAAHTLRLATATTPTPASTLSSATPLHNLIRTPYRWWLQLSE